MLAATKPFNDKVTNYEKEPSLRIGRTLPKGAVNLAYYYNPTATDSEKVLAAAAPRQTIDHRVEEAYRYLFNQASDDDDLFPKSILYQDEEGYRGFLGRMYVNWYKETHIKTKNIKQTKEFILNSKSEVPKMFEYSDVYGFKGNLYFDVADFEVTKEKDVTTVEMLERKVLNHEVSYYDIHGAYLKPNQIDSYMEEPNATSDTLWPRKIIIHPFTCQASGGQNSIVNYINHTPSHYDEAEGALEFSHFEYEQIFDTPAESGSVDEYIISNPVLSKKYRYDKDDQDPNKINAFVQKKKAEAMEKMKSTFEARYNPTTDTYDYSEIIEFLNLVANDTEFHIHMVEAMNQKSDMVVYLDRVIMKIDSKTNPKTNFWFEFYYNYKVGKREKEGSYQYNVIAVYKGTLKKRVTTIKKIPAEYKATCQYIGIARKIWYDYDGVAYYRGAVTKGNSIGNVNPEDDNELLMFSDDKGYLRVPTWITKQNGDRVLRNFYRVEADYVYLTDVFKDNVACFYKYPLKRDLYDYRGPDSNGFYKGNAVSVFTSNLKDLPRSYKYNMKLRVSETEKVEETTGVGTVIEKEIPKRYKAELYTSFVSSSADNYKVVYNAFDDNDKNNIALDNGVTEDVYNYPFMVKDVDFTMESINKRARVNKIKLKEPYRIRDTRHYISFKYKIVAERKGQVKVEDNSDIVLTKPEAKIESVERIASILNKEYALPVEYNKFVDRAMIISPNINDALMSPMDLILYDQAISGQETVIKKGDTDFVFHAEITEIHSTNEGAVNITCNPDGSGLILAETTLDTGFIDGKDLSEFDENTDFSDVYNYTFTKKPDLDSPYFVDKGWIYPGIKVKCVDSRFIKVKSPREDGLLDSWYPMIQFGHYSQVLDQYGKHTKVAYSMPEYDEQVYSNKHGKPCVDIKQQPVEVLNSRMIKLKCFPVFIKENDTTVALWKKLGNDLFQIKIKDISFSDGIIITQDTVNENDDIVADYTYIEENYVYRGFWRDLNDFARIDLNPNIYHTYSDLTYTPSETKPSKNLFNKVIYFFMKPSICYEVAAAHDELIYEEDDSTLGEIFYENDQTLYHQIGNSQPVSDEDIYIGSVYIKQNTSLRSTVLVDSRTRGGGIIETMKDSLRKELEPESDFYLDIGYIDGEPYQENGVIIVRLDNKILKNFGGKFTYQEVEEKVKRFMAHGVYPIIEYVNTYSYHDMPQSNLEIQDEYLNQNDIKPELTIEVVDL